MDEHARTEKGRLEVRLERLERQSRWLRRGLLLAAGCLAGAVAMGQRAATPGTLRVAQLLICDSEGRPRAELGLTGGDAVHLDLLDVRQRRRLRLHVSPAAGPRCEFFDSLGALQVSITGDQHGGAAIELNGGSAPPAARLAVSSAGTPSLELVENRAEYTASLRARVERAPRLELRNWDAAPAGVLLLDGRDRVRASMLADAAGVPRLALLGDDGRVLFCAP